VKAALAAETAEGVAHAEAFYAAPEFWVAIAFVVLVALLARPAYRHITKSLDEKIGEIRDRLDESTRLREEAQELLASIKRKQADAAKETEDIVALARDEAALMRDRLHRDLETSLARREQLAKERIAQAETDAIAEVRRMTADVAIDATRTLLVDAAAGAKASELVDSAISELGEKLN
jgi:F-type H+-transporting ATPase subunit b